MAISNYKTTFYKCINPHNYGVAAFDLYFPIRKSDMQTEYVINPDELVFSDGSVKYVDLLNAVSRADKDEFSFFVLSTPWFCQGKEIIVSHVQELINQKGAYCLIQDVLNYADIELILSKNHINGFYINKGGKEEHECFLLKNRTINKNLSDDPSDFKKINLIASMFDKLDGRDFSFGECFSIATDLAELLTFHKYTPKILVTVGVKNCLKNRFNFATVLVGGYVINPLHRLFQEQKMSMIMSEANFLSKWDLVASRNDYISRGNHLYSDGLKIDFSNNRCATESAP